MSAKKENNVNIQVDKVVTRGGQDTPPEKKNKKKKDPLIPINESDVDGMDYLAE